MARPPVEIETDLALMSPILRPSLPRQPVWRSPRAHGPAALPARLRPWLLDRGSLTQRLIAASGGHFRVHVLHQRVARPLCSEMRLLNMPRRRLALVREVILYGCDQPWVFARSVLPLSSLTGRLRRLRKVDARPLGDYLFRNPGLRRGELQITRLLPTSAALPKELGGLRATLWGRRSVFYVNHKPLLISEFFLPTFTPYNNPLEEI